MSRRINTSQKISFSDNQMNRKGAKLIFTTYNAQSCALLLGDDRLIAAEFFAGKRSEVGSIHICRVKSVVKNLDAYFVEIGNEKREVCFLSQKDAAYPYLLNRKWDGKIKEGDEFPVQVVRDAQKTKQASVSTLISLSNDYFAMGVGDTRTGYSNKLTAEEKKNLKSFFKKANIGKPAPVPLPMDDCNFLPIGMVVRTKAGEFLKDGVAKKDVAIDAKSDASEICMEQCKHAFNELQQRLLELFQMVVHRSCFSCLVPAPGILEEVMGHLVSATEYDEILTDDDKIYAELQEKRSNENVTMLAGKKIRLYTAKEQEELSLSQLYGLKSKIEAATGRRVWLKSGAYLVIDPTEALTVIDVNSGKCDIGKSTAETFRTINFEAAQEIALQLRLRNLSGIVIVDFINMSRYEDQKELLEYLKKLTATDRQQTKIVDITPLGLVEITRRKTGKPLSEQISAFK